MIVPLPRNESGPLESIEEAGHVGIRCDQPVTDLEPAKASDTRTTKYAQHVVLRRGDSMNGGNLLRAGLLLGLLLFLSSATTAGDPPEVFFLDAAGFHPNPASGPDPVVFSLAPRVQGLQSLFHPAFAPPFDAWKGKTFSVDYALKVYKVDDIHGALNVLNLRDRAHLDVTPAFNDAGTVSGVISSSLDGSMFRMLRMGQRVLFDEEEEAGTRFARDLRFGSDGY